MWPAAIVQRLAPQLPDEYTAEPRVHLGNYYEIEFVWSLVLVIWCSDGSRPCSSKAQEASLLPAITMDKLRLPSCCYLVVRCPPMNQRSENPVLTSSRREAVLVMSIWLVACVSTIGICYWLGYDRDVTTLTFVFGFPDWIFWGIIVPWTVCTALCFIVPRYVITDEDLGEEQTEESLGSAGDAAQEAAHG
jgi:hypothetical protein